MFYILENKAMVTLEKQVVDLENDHRTSCIEERKWYYKKQNALASFLYFSDLQEQLCFARTYRLSVTLASPKI